MAKGEFVITAGNFAVSFGEPNGRGGSQGGGLLQIHVRAAFDFASRIVQGETIFLQKVIEFGQGGEGLQMVGADGEMVGPKPERRHPAAVFAFFAETLVFGIFDSPGPTESGKIPFIGSARRYGGHQVVDEFLEPGGKFTDAQFADENFRMDSVGMFEMPGGQFLVRKIVFSLFFVSEEFERAGKHIQIYPQVVEGPKGDVIVYDGFAARLEQGMDLSRLRIEVAIILPKQFLQKFKITHRAKIAFPTPLGVIR